MKRLLLCLQYYAGDQAMGMRLARLIADLEAIPSAHADFMFACRHGCDHDPETIRYVSKKFPRIHTLKGERKSQGWPQGPNDLFAEAYNRFCLRVRQKEWDYDAALFFEPDCVPLSRDWIKKLQTEWYEKEQLILGYIHEKGEHPYPHVNGNCIISAQFQRQCHGFAGSLSQVGWDVYHAKTMLRYARASRLIWNDYARKTITCEELFSARHKNSQEYRPVFLHGVKDLSAQDCVRYRFNLP